MLKSEEGMLKGKKGVILGIANKRSIAWGITQAAVNAGAEVALTYAGDRLKGNVEDLAAQAGIKVVLPCDVSQDEDIDRMADDLKDTMGHIDFMVHAIAFARKEELAGNFYDVSREGYLLAQNVSSFSLTALTKAILPLMEGRNGSIVTLTYLGGPRVIPNYNVMGVAKAALEASVRYLANDLGPQGIRVNAISAGPVKTLSAAGVSSFGKFLQEVPQRTPLRRNVTVEEIGDVGVFLLSDMSRAMTGEVLYVDGGYHILGH